MKIDDGSWKYSAAVVVSLHRKDLPASAFPRTLQDRLIWQIAAGNEQVHRRIRQLCDHSFIVGDHEDCHFAYPSPRPATLHVEMRWRFGPDPG